MRMWVFEQATLKARIVRRGKAKVVPGRALKAYGKITYIVFFIEGPRSRCYGRTAAVKAYCATLWWSWLVFFVFPCNGAPVEWNWQGKTEVLGEKIVPVPLCLTQIPHGLNWDRTRASTVRGRRLTAWDMARSIYLVSFIRFKTLH
jgi:hypothetical protein